jgi:hypothetical protein
MVVPKRLSENLHALQMDWDLRPYWCFGAQRECADFLRSFPRLETLTLVIKPQKFAREYEEASLMETAKRYTSEVMTFEKGRNPGWRSPEFRFLCKKDKVDWGFHYISSSLLAENHREKGLLYIWSKE